LLSAAALGQDQPQAEQGWPLGGVQESCALGVDETWSTLVNTVCAYEIRYPGDGMLASWALDGELVCVYLNEGLLLIYCSAEPQIYEAGTGGFAAVRSQEALDSFLSVLVGQLTFRIAPFSTYGGFETWDEGFNALVQGADFWCTVTLLIEATGGESRDLAQVDRTEQAAARLTKLGAPDSPEFALFLRVLCTFRLLQ